MNSHKSSIAAIVTIMGLAATSAANANSLEHSAQSVQHTGEALGHSAAAVTTGAATIVAIPILGVASASGAIAEHADQVGTRIWTDANRPLEITIENATIMLTPDAPPRLD